MRSSNVRTEAPVTSPMTFTRQRLRNCLTRDSSDYIERPPRTGHEKAPRAAAVLIPMLETESGWHLLFIRRAENDNDDHSGQIAFPGGRFEPRDADLAATALREAFEEIGLARGDVEIVGQLGDFVSATNYRITPVVGMMPWPYPLRLATCEVARAFTIPLRWLADPDNREVHDYPTPAGAIPVIRFRPYAGELLWGATARMTVSLIETLTGEIDLNQGR